MSRWPGFSDSSSINGQAISSLVLNSLSLHAPELGAFRIRREVDIAGKRFLKRCRNANSGSFGQSSSIFSLSRT